MVWFKVDDDLAFHAKALRAGNTAMGVWVRAGSQCGKQLTDGFIDREVALTIGRMVDIRRLVDAGLWEPAEVDGRPGWRFHQFLDRNPSREEVEEKREAEARRKAEWRAKRAAKRTPGPAADDLDPDASVPPGQTPDTTRDARGTDAGVPDLSRSSRPDPTRPDPVSPNGDTPSLRSGGAARRASRIPDDFSPDDQMRHWAGQRGFTDPQIDEITSAFVRYWQAESGAKASKLDWPKTWQNWVAKEDPRRVRAVVSPMRPSGALTREQVDDLLGPDTETLIPPEDLDPAEDRGAYQAWMRQARVDRLAERERQARELLERRRGVPV